MLPELPETLAKALASARVFAEAFFAVIWAAALFAAIAIAAMLAEGAIRRIAGMLP